ncbi:MAG TPA: hypothetical protein VG742_13635 [Dongiaceae bacterium]|nr:hypothetical protein [Dongiaceae bacterium]
MNTDRNIEWLEPWYPVDDPEERSALEGQLALELSEGHILFGQKAILIGRCGGSDDALFLLSDGRVAEVHLVWQGRQRSPWPSTGIFPSISVWVRESMIPRHREWASDD